MPVAPDHGRNVHLSEQQALELAKNVLAEYELRTGGTPLRVVLHKTSYFDTAERAGFAKALKDAPIVSMVTLVPSLFRLLRYGSYPPKVGTVCTINAARSFLSLPVLCQNSAPILARMSPNLSRYVASDLRVRSPQRKMFSTSHE